MHDLTVIIPHYNDHANLEKLVHSILSQVTSFAVHIIVCDDGSKHVPFFNHPNILVISNQKNRGTGFTRNKLMSLIKTKYALAIDSDCFFEKPNILQNLWDIREHADIIYPTVELHNGSRIHPRNSYEVQYIRMSTCFLFNNDKMKDLNIVFRNIFIFFYEDEDFFIECQKAGLSARYYPTIKVKHGRDIVGHGERRFGHFEWYSLYLGLLLIYALHGKKYFHTREFMTLDEIDEFITYRRYNEGRLSGLVRALLMFMVLFPKVFLFGRKNKTH